MKRPVRKDSRGFTILNAPRTLYIGLLNNLPSNEYFAQFVTLQHSGLVATRESLSAGKWERQIEPFISDLGVSTMDELLDVQRLGNAYEQVVKPLVSLAANQGFCVGWRY